MTNCPFSGGGAVAARAAASLRAFTAARSTAPDIAASAAGEGVRAGDPAGRAPGRIAPVFQVLRGCAATALPRPMQLLPFDLRWRLGQPSKRLSHRGHAELSPWLERRGMDGAQVGR